jgi:molybdenum-dependent DNA-binding transcriptional regulator ModE
LPKAAFFLRCSSRRAYQSAKRHGISLASVSDIVRQMEVSLGVRLIEPTTRSAPTAAGERLSERLHVVLADYEAACPRARSWPTPHQDWPALTAASNSTPISSSAPSARWRSAARTTRLPDPTAVAPDGLPFAPSSPPPSSTSRALLLSKGRVGTRVQRTSDEPPRRSAVQKPAAETLKS